MAQLICRKFTLNVSFDVESKLILFFTTKKTLYIVCPEHKLVRSHICTINPYLRFRMIHFFRQQFYFGWLSIISAIFFHSISKRHLSFFRLISRFFFSGFTYYVTEADRVWRNISPFFSSLILLHQFDRFNFISFDGWTMDKQNCYWKHFWLFHYSRILHKY